MKFDLSVVVPTLMQSSSLRDCLASIVSAAGGSDLNLEILVVDNSQFPTDTSAFTPLNPAPNCQLRFITSKRGANLARNRGLDEAQANVVLFIDDDCIVLNSDFFIQHHSFHIENPEAFAAGGNYLVSKRTNSWEKSYVLGQQMWLTKGKGPDSSQTGYLLGGNFSVKKSICLSRDIRFDENLKYGGTETEFFVHAATKQLKSYYIEAHVEHRCRLNPLQLCLKAYRQGLGKRYREQKWSPTICNRIYVSGKTTTLPSIRNRHLESVQGLFFGIGYKGWLKQHQDKA